MVSYYSQKKQQPVHRCWVTRWGATINISAVINNSYIPQREQHEPNLLDVTPSNLMPHPLSPPPIPLCVIDLVAKQHPHLRLHAKLTQIMTSQGTVPGKLPKII